ncbi:MAG: hypothetical protein EOO78_37635, partial [Oxalobacteraceae bacterium]
MKKQLNMFAPRRLVLPLLATLVLSACGSNDDDTAQPPQAVVTPVPVAVVPESTRAQDTRTFAVSQTATTFAALSGAPDSDRWMGVLNNASYQVEVPK